jgi:hypothetical protein
MTRAGIVDGVTLVGGAFLVAAVIAGSWSGGFELLMGFLFVALAWLWSILPYVVIVLGLGFGMKIFAVMVADEIDKRK